MTSVDLIVASAEPAFGAGPDGVARFVGIEQEFEVWNGDRRVDFRDLIHAIPFDGLRLDPGDVNAYRLRNGMVITSDEAEAEVACPPIPVESGFALVGQRWAASARRLLAAALPAGYSLRGYSTHISVSLPGPPNEPFAEAYARRFGPVFAQIVERSDSLGVYIRPRPNRIELCGEFVEGDRLGAALAFAAGTVNALVHGFPFVETQVDLLPCVERFGYRVHRNSLGFDAYTAGRAAGIPLANGLRPSLQSLAEAALAASRTGLAQSVAPGDLSHLAAMLMGSAPLGVEVQGEEFIPSVGEPPVSHYGAATHHWQSGHSRIEPFLATWAFSVFRISSRERAAFVLVPGVELAKFASALDADPEGEAARLAAAASGELKDPGQTAVQGVFTAVATDPVGLLHPELPVAGGKAPHGDHGRHGKSGGRPGKVSVRPWKFVPLPSPISDSTPPLVPDVPPAVPPLPIAPPDPPAPPPEPPAVPVPPAPPAPTPPPPGGGPSKGVITAVGGAIIAVVVVVGAWVASQGGDDPVPTPTPAVTVVAANTATPNGTPRPTETPRLSETPRPSPTPTKAADATTAVSPTPTAGGVATNQPATATATPSATATSTATIHPTETVPPTSTPTRTSTPTPTSHPTEIPPTKAPGPTATPTRPIDPLPTPAPTSPPCVPVGGKVCE